MMKRTPILSALFAAGAVCIAFADHHGKLPVVAKENFEKGASRWAPTDAKAWKLVSQDGNHAFALVGESDYKPPFRSPFNYALLKEVTVSDFELTARVQSTTKDYGHRSLVLVFGFQDPAHFYYVHLGKVTDDHCNQIFIVNGAPRTKISLTTTKGTPWTENWHSVKIVREPASGKIEIYFDNMEKTAMTAKDETFKWGQIGVGSFDDTGNFDDIVIRGHAVKADD